MTKKVERKSIEDIPVVIEFFDVFIDDHRLGLSPIREIKFGIDLELSVAPVHKAPYRMALAELKVQFQKLLDKGFIQPSTLP